MNNQYKKQIEAALRGPEIGLGIRTYDFNGARRAVFNSERIRKLMMSQGIRNTQEISSGVSDAKAFRPYLEQAAKDLLAGNYYRGYYPNKGEVSMRQALVFFENCKFNGTPVYDKEDVCLTEGSTGAISGFIEYLARQYPGKEAIITNPCYYLYRSACIYSGLPYREVSLFEAERNKNTRFTAIGKLLSAITDRTKLIILNNPFNPSGEVYEKRDLVKLLTEAKRRNILILVDELFSDLVFQPDRFQPADSLAKRLNAMENVVVVKGYSKNKNLVALRLGYLLSKKREIIDGVAKITQVRQSFPSACNYAGMLILDAFVQSVLFDGQAPTLARIRQVRKRFPALEPIKAFADEKLLRLSCRYKRYSGRLMEDYSKAYDLSARLLEPFVSYMMPKVSAFNTFVRMPSLNTVNMFDFTVNLYVETGVKIEIGPCFGFSQKDWETRPEMGFWLRITFAKDPKILSDGIKAFIAFARKYNERDTKWIRTGCRF